MSSKVNSLLIAWACSLILVVGGTLLLEATYTPPTAEEAASEPAQEEEGLADASNPTDEPAETVNTEQPSGLANTEATLPAPGQADSSLQPAPVGPNGSVSAIPASIPAAPLPELLEEITNYGQLPKIAADGRRPSDVYAAPRNANASQARIALLVTDLGKKSRQTQRALDELPKEVSLAFSVYGINLHDWGRKARTKGHEVFLAVPMEPSNYPQNDPGPMTLLTSQSRQYNEHMLRTSLGKFSGYVGVVNYMGSRFTAASESIRPVLDELKRRGLMFVDNRDSNFSIAASMAAGINMPWAINNRYIDEEPDASLIALQLEELEKRARAQGAALGMARAYPVTFDTINVWAATLEERGFTLVPVSSIAGQQALPR